MRDKKNNYWVGFICMLFTCVALTVALAAEEKEKQPKKVNQKELPLPRHPDPSIIEVQKQLAEIIEIQKSLRIQRDQQVAEIQTIMDQARAHQKLLEELKQMRERPVEAKTQIDEAIRREKIQLIEQQAIKNQAALEKYKKEEFKEETSDEAASLEASEPIPDLAVSSIVTDEPVPSAPLEDDKAEEKQKKNFWW